MNIGTPVVFKVNTKNTSFTGFIETFRYVDEKDKDPNERWAVGRLFNIAGAASTVYFIVATPRGEQVCCESVLEIQKGSEEHEMLSVLEDKYLEAENVYDNKLVPVGPDEYVLSIDETARRILIDRIGGV